MKQSKSTYNIGQSASSVLMILALLWLTVSAPFVFAFQQEIKKNNATEASSPITCNDEEATSPFGNNTEEKTPGGANVTEEYLHDNHKTEYFFALITNNHKCHDADTYVAYHGELLVPPPNQA